MAIDYDALRVNVAETLIRENGKVAVLLTPNVTGPDYDPIIGLPTESPVFFVETSWKMDDRTKSLVQVGDKMGLVSTEGGAIPNQSINQINIGGEVYQLIMCEPLQPGTVTMLYKIIARK